MAQMSKAYKAAWYQKNKERMKILSRESRLKRKEETARTLNAYRKANPDLIRRIQKKYQQKNSHYYAAKCAERYASKKNSTPKWANDFFIEEIYHLSSLRTKIIGFPWHVDHIVPLRSKLVCGLHTEQNLQVIPATKNYEKRNLVWPDMP